MKSATAPLHERPVGDTLAEMEYEGQQGSVYERVLH
jgi:hypothetical protein